MIDSGDFTSSLHPLALLAPCYTLKECSLIHPYRLVCFKTPSPPQPGKGSRLLSTGSRCIVHSDSEDPSNWSGEYKRSYLEVSENPDFIPLSKVGAKAKVNEAAIREQVVAQRQEELKNIHHEKNRMLSLSSTNNSTFVRHDNISASGRRIMRNQDGLSGAAKPDITYMVEAGTLPPVCKVTDAELLQGCDLNQPITFYSQRLHEGVFAASTTSSVNPFTKNTSFTNDIRDGIKHHAGAIDTPDTKSPSDLGTVLLKTPAMKLSVISLIEKIRHFLRVKNNVNAYKGLRRSLQVMDTSGNGTVSSSALNSTLNTSGVSLTANEIDMLVLEYRSGSGDSVKYRPFLDALLGTMPESRTKLTGAVFDSMSNFQPTVSVHQMGEYFIAESQPSVASGNASPSSAHAAFLSSWGSEIVTKDQFITYYSEISVCIASDQAFDSLVASSWRAKPRTLVPTIHVQVTRGDGSVVNVAVEDPLEVIGTDLALIKTRIRKTHRIHDAVKIELL